MNAIEVWGLENDEPTLDATLTLDDQGQVAFDARDPGIVQFLRQIECPGPRRRRYSYADGEPWLRSLPGVLRGTTCLGEVDRGRTAEPLIARRPPARFDRWPNSCFSSKAVVRYSDSPAVSRVWDGPDQGARPIPITQPVGGGLNWKQATSYCETAWPLAISGTTPGFA